MHPLLTRRQRRAAESEPEPLIDSEHLAWAMESLCAIHGIRFDAPVPIPRTPAPHTWSSVYVAATKLGMRCTHRRMRLSRIPAVCLPCLVLLRDDNCAAAVVVYRPAMIIRVVNAEVAYRVPGETGPRCEPVDKLMRLHTGAVLLAVSAHDGPRREEVPAFPRRLFGLR